MPRSKQFFLNIQIVGIGVLATQFLLGCHRADPDEDIGTGIKTVTVPKDIEHPTQLTGDWIEAKGQKLALSADGKCDMISKVSLGADVTKGKSVSFDQKSSATWGVKGEDFYFTGMKDSPALSFHWKLDSNRLLLTTNGSSLSYTKQKAK